MQWFHGDGATGALLAIGLGFVAFAVASHWLLRPWRRAKFARRAEQFDKQRHLAETDRSYLPLGAAPLAFAEAYARAERELAALSFAPQADLQEVSEDGTVHGVVRWFIGADGSVCAWFAHVVSASARQGKPVMIFFSEAGPGRFCFTGRGMPATGGLALAPGVRRQVLPWSTGAAEALRRHRLVLRQESLAPTKVATLDDALALHRRLRLQTRSWRAAQPAAELLEADIDAVLTPRYRRYAPLLREALARAGTARPSRVSWSSRPRPCARPQSC